MQNYADSWSVSARLESQYTNYENMKKQRL